MSYICTCMFSYVYMCVYISPILQKIQIPVVLQTGEAVAAPGEDSLTYHNLPQVTLVPTPLPFPWK